MDTNQIDFECVGVTPDNLDEAGGGYHCSAAPDHTCESR